MGYGFVHANAEYVKRGVYYCLSISDKMDLTPGLVTQMLQEAREAGGTYYNDKHKLYVVEFPDHDQEAHPEKHLRKMLEPYIRYTDY